MTSGPIVNYPISATSRIWMFDMTQSKRLCQAFLYPPSPQEGLILRLCLSCHLNQLKLNNYANLCYLVFDMSTASPFITNLSIIRDLTNQVMIPDSGIMDQQHSTKVYRFCCPDLFTSLLLACFTCRVQGELE